MIIRVSDVSRGGCHIYIYDSRLCCQGHQDPSKSVPIFPPGTETRSSIFPSSFMYTTVTLGQDALSGPCKYFTSRKISVSHIRARSKRCALVLLSSNRCLKKVSRLESHIRISVKHRTQELIVSGAVRKALYHQRTASCDHAAADPQGLVVRSGAGFPPLRLLR